MKFLLTFIDSIDGVAFNFFSKQIVYIIFDNDDDLQESLKILKTANKYLIIHGVFR